MVGVTKTDLSAPQFRPAAWIEGQVSSILRAAGARPDAARAMARALTEAHLRGVETHGLRRLRPYLARIRSGGVAGAIEPVIDVRDAIVHVDGRNGIGHYVATRAAEAVSEVASRHGIAIAVVRESNHFGFAGHYATLIATRGQLGIVVSNGQVCVGPEGARRALLSNDPLAIAAPTGDPGRFLELDLAASVTSRANIVEAARSGTPLPAGLAQDRDGKPTCDPRAALEGSLLAFGGQKGFALLFALEVIAGVLTGGAYADQVSSKEALPDAPERTAHTLIAIDLAKTLGSGSFESRLDDLIHRLAALPVAAGAEAARYPGQRRWELRRQRLRDGIPLQPGEIADLGALAAELGLQPLA